MKRIGITGQHGFVGQHLFNALNLKKEYFQVIDFYRNSFEDNMALDSFIAQCDVIVHLASKNRHADPEVLYETNVNLTQKLVDSLKRVNSKAHIIFSSSTQEDNGSPYGRSKVTARKLLVNWARESGCLFTGLIIPNVFGPFGNPYYNSVTATFCHQLVNDETCNIQVDSELKLIYVGDLVNKIINIISDQFADEQLEIPHSYEIKVSALLKILQSFKTKYLENGIIPAFSNLFEINLFNTFRSYIDVKNHFPVKYKKHADERGVFSELIRLNGGGQVSYSETLSGMTRGNHFHTRKIERFAVIKGLAVIQLRKIGTTKTIDFHLSGDKPAYVDMPIWYTHNIKNIGNEPLLTIFWINEFYNPEDPDTYFEIV